MSDDPLSLEFIGRQLTLIQAEQRRARGDMDTMIALVVGHADWFRKVDQRMAQFDLRMAQFDLRMAQFEQRMVEQTDVLVAEFKGRIGISQMQVEKAVDELTDRVEELETGKSRFTP